MKIIKQIFLLALFGWFNTSYAQVVIQVVDQNNKPVNNAVISSPLTGSAQDNLPPAIMDQVNKAFFPEVLLIQKGQFVRFPNSDNIRHHVYSFSETKPFEIKLYSGTPSEPIRFEKEGIVVLGCNIHDQMVGYIYVTDQQQTELTNKKGIVVLSDSQFDEVTVWHARLSDNISERMVAPLTQKNKNGDWLIQVSLKPEVVKKVKNYKSRFK